MGEHRTLKLLKGRVCGDTIVASEGVAALDIFSQNEGRLAFAQFSYVDRFRTTPTCEDGLSRCPQIAHPIHYSKHRAHIALPIVLPNRYRDRTRLPAFAPTHREQVHGVIPSSFELDARSQQGHGQHICCPHKQRGLICFCHCFLLLLFQRDVVMMTTTCDHSILERKRVELSDLGQLSSQFRKAAACSAAHWAKVRAGRPRICSIAVVDGPGAGSCSRRDQYPSSLSGTSSGRPWASIAWRTCEGAISSQNTSRPMASPIRRTLSRWLRDCGPVS